MLFSSITINNVKELTTKELERLINEAINVNQTQNLIDNLLVKLFDFSVKVVGAILLWWIGSRLIRLTISLTEKAVGERI